MSDIRLDISQVSPWAGLMRRVGAGLLDTVIVTAPVFLIAIYVFGEKVGIRGPGAGPSMPVSLGNAQGVAGGPMSYSIHVADLPYFPLILAAIFLLYKTLCESSRLMATPGKLVLGIRVMTAEGRPPPWPRALLRSWPWWLGAVATALAAKLDVWAVESAADILRFIAVAMIALTPRKQGLHDLMARCYVVRAGARPAR